MSATPTDPLDPLAWIARADSNLLRTKIGRGIPGVFLEDLAFDAQQAVEKAFKALLVARRVSFPKTHDLTDLLNRLTSAGLSIPAALHSAVTLTSYAVRTRYPGGQSITEEDYQAAVKIAEEVVAWVRVELGRPA